MMQLSEFDKAQVDLLATYSPYATYDVAKTFIRLGKSFDYTFEALTIGSTNKSLDIAIMRVCDERGLN